MHPADTTRTRVPAQSPITADPRIDFGDLPTTSNPNGRPLLYTSAGLPCQPGPGELPKQEPLRFALAQTAVSFTDEFLSNLLQLGIESHIADPAAILHRLDKSPGEWDIIGYPVTSTWQRALEFAREVRRVRERNGAMPYPRILIISFQEQFSATVEWFRRVSGTRYWRFTSDDDFAQVMRQMHSEILESVHRLHKLHLRLVHSGNRFGVGCIEGEVLEAVYVSFCPGIEDELEEAGSILQFANLMGMHRWRARTALQFVHLMQGSPFYSPRGLNSNALGRSSIKTYVLRLEKALLRIWRKQNGEELPPQFVGRESRGGREIAYRLLANIAIDHV